MQNAEIQKKLDVSEAIKVIEKDRDKLANELKIKETETQLFEKSIKEQFANKLVVKDETIKMKDDEIQEQKITGCSQRHAHPGGQPGAARRQRR